MENFSEILNPVWHTKLNEEEERNNIQGNFYGSELTGVALSFPEKTKAYTERRDSMVQLFDGSRSVGKRQPLLSNLYWATFVCALKYAAKELST